jgi:hypothetical protein
LTNSSVRELRAAERFRLKLPVSLTWQVRKKQDQYGHGFTRDISTRGMFVLARTCPPMGKPLRFEINLALNGSAAIRVEGRGRVIRVERTASKATITGFAVVNLWFRMGEPRKASATPARPRSAAVVRP